MIAALALAVAVAHAGTRCTYRYSVWNVNRKRSERQVSVDKPRDALTAAEKDPTGCTPCSEDQVPVRLSNGLQFRICRTAAGGITRALEAAMKRGQRVTTVVGYRAQMSRGPTDSRGDRTELSNHAFGVAVDVNEGSNGLYEECPRWAPTCRLRKAGPYNPGRDALSFTKTSPLVEEMAREGFKWGGEIEGRQKDFMHFSPTGY